MQLRNHTTLSQSSKHTLGNKINNFSDTIYVAIEKKSILVPICHSRWMNTDICMLYAVITH